MSRKKTVREKGKLKLSRYFQKLKEGEQVAVVRELSVRVNFPKRLQGRTGVVEGERGKSYIVNIKDINKEKKHIIAPIHLKKIKQL